MVDTTIYITEQGRTRMLELLMTVGYIFKDGEKRIVGGAEAHYPTNDLSWLDFSGEEIMVRTSKSDMFFKVKKIDVFPSISGAINVGLTLNADSKFDAINIGDKVFRIVNINTD